MLEASFFHINLDGKLVLLETLEKALSAMKKGGYIWLNYAQPTKEELSLLIEPLGLHPLSIEDCINENQIPKIEEYPRYTFLICNIINYDQGEMSINEADMFIGADFLVTVTGHNSENQQLMGNIEHIIKQHPENIRQGPAFFLHLILDHIIDQKFVIIEMLEEELDKAEDDILSDLSSFNPASLLHMRRNLLALRKSLFHEREVFVKICRKDCLYIPEKLLFHYRDIYDHITIFFELIETSREIVTSLMEMYLSLLNNQMAITANKTNSTVRRLTFITTIFMPLTLLAGIGGMSEYTMMTNPGNWHIAYPVFLLGMLVLGIAAYFFLKRLEKKDQETDLPSVKSDI
jgi:magnesium transporter